MSDRPLQGERNMETLDVAQQQVMIRFAKCQNRLTMVEDDRLQTGER